MQRMPAAGKRARRDGEEDDGGLGVNVDEAQMEEVALPPGADEDAEYVLLNDDVLTSVANATLVLLDGSDLERMAVLYQFPQFLEHCPDETLTIMVPEIGLYAVGWKQNVQMAAAEALYFVVNMAVPVDVANRIVVAALHIIEESESGEVFDAWGEILSMMLPQVKRDDVESLVVPATVNRAASSQVESRRLAARIIGSLNDTLTADELHSKFLEHALVLCDDNDASVRAMIAQSLASLGTKLPLRVSEECLWPKLDRLMHDQNPRVRAAAMRAVARTAEAHSAHSHQSASYKNLLLPVFLRECATAYDVAGTDLRTVDDDTYLMLEIFSEVYGYFLCAVSPLFASNDVWTDALNSLRRMVTCNGPTVRHWCAFNVPAVAQVCGRDRPEKIHGVVQALSSDTDVETRATLAAGIHETTALLADGPLRDEMLAAIAMLMTDQNPQVRMNSLGHFADILTLLSETGPMAEGHAGEAGHSQLNGKIPKKSPAGGADEGNTTAAATTSMTTSGNYRNPNTINSLAARQLDPIVSSLETMSHDSWRTQKLLAEQLEASAKLVPQEMLCEHVAPLLFSMARESTYLVRKASMSALVSVIRYIPDVRRRDHILKHFRSEWARGKVYWTRLAYIDASQVALNVLSSKLFAHLFAPELFNLAKDPVPNVRLRLARIMPEVAIACGGKSGFVGAMDVLLSDSEDPDVVHEARLAKKAIASRPPRTFAEADEDEKKEAAEKQFFIQRSRKKGHQGGSGRSGGGGGGGTGGTGSGGGALGSGNPARGLHGADASGSSRSAEARVKGGGAKGGGANSLPNGTAPVIGPLVVRETGPVVPPRGYPGTDPSGGGIEEVGVSTKTRGAGPGTTGVAAPQTSQGGGADDGLGGLQMARVGSGATKSGKAQSRSSSGGGSPNLAPLRRGLSSGSAEVDPELVDPALARKYSGPTAGGTGTGTGTADTHGRLRQAPAAGVGGTRSARRSAASEEEALAAVASSQQNVPPAATVESASAPVVDAAAPPKKRLGGLCGCFGA